MNDEILPVTEEVTTETPVESVNSAVDPSATIANEKKATYEELQKALNDAYQANAKQGVIIEYHEGRLIRLFGETFNNLLKQSQESNQAK